jgi:3-phenylpropionate/cinnamic acid dioxygenase small subunit
MIIFDSIEIIHFDGNADASMTEIRWNTSVDNYELLGRPSFITSRKTRRKKGLSHFMVFDISVPTTASVSLLEQRHFDEAGEGFHLFHDRKEDEKEHNACFVFDRMASDSSLAQQPLTKPQRRVSEARLLESSTQEICSQLEYLVLEAPTKKRGPVDSRQKYQMTTHWLAATTESLAQQQPLTKPQRRVSDPRLLESSAQEICSQLEYLVLEAPTSKRGPLDSRQKYHQMTTHWLAATTESLAQQQPLTKPQRRVSDPRVLECSTTQAFYSKVEYLLDESPTTKRGPVLDSRQKYQMTTNWLAARTAESLLAQQPLTKPQRRLSDPRLLEGSTTTQAIYSKQHENEPPTMKRTPSNSRQYQTATNRLTHFLA